MYAWIERKVAQYKYSAKRGTCFDVAPDKDFTGSTVVDHSAWDSLLKEKVQRNEIDGIELNVIDYKSLSEDERFSAYRNTLSSVSLGDLSPNEKLCLYINAYNFLCIDKIISSFKEQGKLPKSILELKKSGVEVWDQPAGIVGGETLTLGQLEHDILRSKWNEPRIHACIVCASVSCPDLRKEAFMVDRLNEQMNDQVSQWLLNEKKGSAVRGKTIHLSRIFNWFHKDFVDADPEGTAHWVTTFLPEDNPRSKVLKSKHSTKYFSYNWNLNVSNGTM
mmetsp:Transcript_13863/g.16815  ORF Transcript_13863/g.16815 Transcript_13863/m.16815 type:complete len:277 (-) Transcript_13863:1088-1918(-)